MLAGYNAGSVAAIRYGGIAPYAQTQGYVRRIRTLMVRYAAHCRRTTSQAATGGTTAYGAAGVVVAFASAKLGQPYLCGRTGPLYDCSGLVQGAYAAGREDVVLGLVGAAGYRHPRRHRHRRRPHGRRPPPRSSRPNRALQLARPHRLRPHHMTNQTTPAPHHDPVPSYRPAANRRAGSARHARHRQLIHRQRPQRSTIHSQTVTYGPAAGRGAAAAPEPGF